MKLNAILDAVRAVGMAHNGGKGGEFILVATESQLVKLTQKLYELSKPEVTHDPVRTDAERDAKDAANWREMAPLWAEDINRRATVEQWMFDAARGKRSMPTPEELREWALKLGTRDAR